MGTHKMWLGLIKWPLMPHEPASLHWDHLPLFPMHNLYRTKMLPRTSRAAQERCPLQRCKDITWPWRWRPSARACLSSPWRQVNHCGTTAFLIGQGDGVSLRLHPSHCLVQVPSFTLAPSSEEVCWVSFPQFSCSASVILPPYSPHPKKEKLHPTA